ncbi:MAG: hypothetical protein C0483_10230 [Pirellula sp.]|nr:hypothetical protein [Pirellula sp.]
MKHNTTTTSKVTDTQPTMYLNMSSHSMDTMSRDIELMDQDTILTIMVSIPERSASTTETWQETRFLIRPIIRLKRR